MNQIFNNNENISGLYIGDLEAEKVYVGDALVYENSPQSSFPNLCYGVTDDISTYTATTFSEVYDTSSNKWYMLNNFNQYEEYGVYEEVSCEATLEEIPTYVGKLVNHCDGHEFECVEFDDGFPIYDYLGFIETITEETEETIIINNTSPSPLIGTIFPTNFKIAKANFDSRYFANIGITGTNGESLNVDYNSFSSPNPVTYSINNNSQNVYDDGEYYVFESNEADFEVESVQYWDSTPTVIIYSVITEETTYPKEYDEKSSPDNYITFDTMEEAYSYSGCVYVGMVAIIGGDGYMLNDNYEWEESQSLKHLNFTATNGDATIRMMTGGTALNISYSFDKETWTSWDYSDITIPNGSTLYMKGTNSTMDGGWFAMSGSIAANGNIMSLLYGDNFIGQLTIPSNNCFTSLFMGCTGLTTAPILPATTLTENCYGNMFNGCESLTSAPQLPAKTLATYCYNAMFNGCTSLTAAPQLPATTLVNNCYWDMFYGCSSLTSAPTLPATTLTEYCYFEMFRGCTSLTQAPQLPATILRNSCYYNMFYGCSNLNYIKMMATDISANNCLYNWVNGVAASGTFVKNANATWTTTGESGIPTGWTVETASS